jgi:hypothetical protein
MLSGNPNRRSFNPNNIEDTAISYVCLDNAGGHDGDPAWAQRNSFFEHNCPNGMRVQVNFPNCWDGVNLDSADHKSHMSWPVNGNNNGNGDCPASHPVKIVALFYEFFFEVQKFPFNPPGTPTWVFANGDTTGYGLHADFLNGWPELVNGTNVLQRAINECNANNGVGGNLQNCPPFAGLINNAQSSSCRPQNPLVNEDIGMGREIPNLPGNNPIWIGNGTKPTRANFTEGSPSFTDFKSVIPTGWTSVGCVAEGTSGRALSAYSFNSANMTLANCAAECGKRGYPLAGAEYSKECYCDFKMQNGASNTTLLPAERCSMQCSGNSFENCGGPSTLSIFVNNANFPAPGAGQSVMPTGWKNVGCIAEGTSGRALSAYTFASSNMTLANCAAECGKRGYPLAGAEYSRECFCDFQMQNGASNTTLISDNRCNMKCSGNEFENCGGPSTLNLIVNNALFPAPVSVPGWTDRGCYSEASSGRALSDYTFAGSDMTIPKCLAECGKRGLRYGGLEYARECFCGNTLAAGSVPASSGCSMACAGDKLSMCGGPSRLNMYEANAATQTAQAQQMKVAAKPTTTTTKAAAKQTVAPVKKKVARRPQTGRRGRAGRAG